MRCGARVITWVGAMMLMAGAAGARVSVDEKIATAQFARQELAAALQKAGGGEGLNVELAVKAGAPAESFTIRVNKKGGETAVQVTGADAGGMLYGALELAETIRLEGLQGIRDAEGRPRLAMRGVKFNIPLDARTPSYTDVSDAAQKNIAEMWSYDFWTGQIDNLARARYNAITLWSLHPFPSLVKVPEYPDVALADVKRSTVKWQENYSLQGKGFDAPEILDHLETLKTMSIEEKIEFWRKVMRYAKSRNVDFYVVTWNIFVNGTYGKYGITDAIDNPVTADYFRKSVRTMFQTYPLLAGIGLTTGENMDQASHEQKEDWAWRTYGLGVLDAAQAQPGRKIRLIHRQHMSGAKAIAEKFAPLIKHPDIDFVFSFKYAQAHALSSTRQPFADGFIKDLKGMDGVKTLWTLRNDDNYHFRWGAPDFVREFMKGIPEEVSAGYTWGSDQWIWGREFMSTEPETPRALETEKHWYSWMLWGRMGYDPGLENGRIVKLIAEKFPKTDAQKLFEAWQEASLIYPLTTGFHWGALDFQWYIEACKSRPEVAQTASGFHDVNRFITLAPHPGTDNVAIPQYVKAVAAGREVQGTTPPQAAGKIRKHADAALALLEGLKDGGDKELRLTLGDIRAMACLGRYYSHKIRGATALALYRAKGDDKNKKAALAELREAAQWWGRYTAQARAQYANPLWTNRVGYVDWEKLTKEVEQDIRIAEKAKPGS